MEWLLKWFPFLTKKKKKIFHILVKFHHVSYATKTQKYLSKI